MVVDKAFSLSKVDSIMTLKPVTALKVSCNIIKDINLCWQQMTMGKISLLHHMSRVNWSANHTTALTHFF
jgi:hypothetical protein